MPPAAAEPDNKVDSEDDSVYTYAPCSEQFRDKQPPLHLHLQGRARQAATSIAASDAEGPVHHIESFGSATEVVAVCSEVQGVVGAQGVGTQGVQGVREVRKVHESTAW